MVKTGLIAAMGMACSMAAIGSAFASTRAASHDQALQDSRITKEVQATLARDVPDSRYQVRVSTMGPGIVTLRGATDTGYTELQELRDARRVPGVKEVKNELRVIA